jgi:hypothetical protein
VATGTGLDGATSVTVGGTSATITDNDATTVTFTTPAKAAGSHDVVVTTAGGPSDALPLYFEGTPVVWLDSDHVTTVSGLVSAMANMAQSDVDLSVAQSTVGNRPALTTPYAAFNNQPAIVHDGLDDRLVSAVLGAAKAQPLTLYVVAQWTALGNRFLLDDADASSRVALLDDLGGGLWAFASANMIGGTEITAGSVNCICVVFNGASSASYINDATTAVVSGNPGANGLKSLSIGTNNAGAGPFQGAWTAIGAFSGVHDATTRGRIMTRLKTKYGTP